MERKRKRKTENYGRRRESERWRVRWKNRKKQTDREGEGPTREGERAAVVVRLRSSVRWVSELADAGSVLYTRREGRSTGMMEGSRR